MTKKYTFFWKTKDVFSQWHKSKFSMEPLYHKDRYPQEIEFTTAEQGMMFLKATLFEDFEVAEEILQEQNAKKIKQLGRKVKNFDNSVWAKYRFEIVVHVNMAKFSQNERLKSLLLKSDYLVEASPYDKIWGIGMESSHPDATNPEKWKGLNLLGKALEEVKMRLGNQDATIEKINNIKISKLPSFLNKIDLQTLHKVKLYLDDQYYNVGESPVSDERYDLVKDTLKRKDSTYTVPVGAKLRTGENRVKLPYWLGSADKITIDSTNALRLWNNKNPSSEYVFSEKLDGISCLLVQEDGDTKLYTRGNGVIGADISYLAKYLSTIPKNLPDIAVRGELIMKKKSFEKYRRKGSEKSGYKNARNMVAGLVGAKTARKGISDIDFVVYEIVGDSMPKPSVQLKRLKKLGFSVANWKKSDNNKVDTLSKTFLEMKDTSEYEIDGMIVQTNLPYDRNTSDNPNYLFAFKMATGDAIKETVIKKIEWNVSKWGQLKPVAIIEPVSLADITMKRVTAHNAKYVEENNLGKGAIIKVTRSNDVIPYIVSVVKEAKKPDMPLIEYVWDANHVNVIVKKTDDTMCIKLIASFFSKLNIKHVSEATVRKMFADGLNNLIKIIGASEKRLLQVPEFQARSAERIYTNIHNGLKNVKLATLLGASGIFGYGIGRRKMDALLLDCPELLSLDKKMTKSEMKKTINSIEGFSDITTNKIVENIPLARKLIEKLSKYTSFKDEERVSSDLKGQKFVMTGFRDAEMEEEIAKRGGKVMKAVSKNTTGLIVKLKPERLTVKLQKASDMGIPIYEREEFKEKFLT